MPTWSYDSTWNTYPRTAAIDLVREALDRGLVAGPAIAYITAKGFPAAVVPAGSPVTSSPALQWYAKGDAANGKFQYVAPDGPYPQGWEIRWSPASWVNGLPTAWQIHPFAEPNAPPPPPVETPPNPPPLGVGDPLAAQLAQLVESAGRIVDAVEQSVAALHALSDRIDSLRQNGLRVHL